MLELITIGYLFMAGITMIILGYSIKQIGAAVGAKAKAYYAIAWFLMVTGLIIEIYLFSFEVTIG